MLDLNSLDSCILASFAYFCEGYAGVKPSVDLFRRFFALCFSASGETYGCVSFRIAESMSERYLPIAWDDGAAISRVTKRVDDFHKRWLYVDATEVGPLLEVPSGPPSRHSGWSSQPLEDTSLELFEKRLLEARAHGLTGQHNQQIDLLLLVSYC